MLSTYTFALSLPRERPNDPNQEREGGLVEGKETVEAALGELSGSCNDWGTGADVVVGGVGVGVRGGSASGCATAGEGSIA